MTILNLRYVSWHNALDKNVAANKWIQSVYLYRQVNRFPLRSPFYQFPSSLSLELILLWWPLLRGETTTLAKHGKCTFCGNDHNSCISFWNEALVLSHRILRKLLESWHCRKTAGCPFHVVSGKRETNTSKSWNCTSRLYRSTFSSQLASEIWLRAEIIPDLN